MAEDRIHLKIAHDAGDPLVGSSAGDCEEGAQVEGEQRFHGVVNHSIVGFAEVDLSGRFLFANTRYCEIVGRPLENLLGTTMQCITHPADLERNLPLFEQVVRDGAPCTIEKRYLRPDGEEIWVNNSVSAIRAKDGRVRSVVAVCVDITSQRRAEAALKEGDERLRRLIDNLPHGAVYRAIKSTKFDVARFTFLSAGVEQIFDCTAAEGLADPRRLYGAIHEEDRQRVADEEADAQAHLRQFDAEFRIRRKDGEIRWLHCRSAPNPLADTDVVWEGVMLDITDRKQTESNLREHEDRLRLALDAGQMGTWNWDIRTGVVRWSPRLEAIHGLPPGSFSGTFDAFQRDIHPEDRDRLFSAVETTLASGNDYHIEYRLVLPDGTIRWVEARGTTVRDDAGQPVQMLGVCMEVTERKRTEEDLRFLAVASRSLATLADFESTLQRIASLAVPIFADWCVVSLPDNGGTLRQAAIAHVDPQKVELAVDMHRRWPPSPDAQTGVYHVLRTGQSILVEHVSDDVLSQKVTDPEHRDRLRAIGIRSYMCVPLEVRDKNIGVITFVAAESGRHYTHADLSLAEDLGRRAAIASENARLYAKLQDEARKKDEFLAMLAHELRNPLAPIRSGLDVLRILGTDGDILDTMQQQVEHLVRLVDDLLDLSRIMRGKVDLRREAVPLASLVDRAIDAVRPLIDKHHQQLRVDLPVEPVWLDADPVRLTQVIGNLLNNASKYTETEGLIHVSADIQGGQVAVHVRDSGIGISSELLPRVFDLFTQEQRTIDRSQGGLGIGLTVVKSLVEMHGGSVTVHSAGPGRGSEFSVRLPTLTHSPPAPKPSLELTSIRSLRVLVVDDNVSAAKMLGLLLGKLGDHEVVLAHDGISAVATAKQHQPDLILLDIGLPRMDGYEVARSLRQLPQFSETLLVALTGYGTEEDRQKSLDAGCDEHLVKPPGVQSLRELLVHPKLPSLGTSTQ